VRQLSVEELLCEPAVHKHGACQVDGERPVQELAEGGVAAHAAHVCTLPTAEGVCNARARGLGAHELDDRGRAVGHHLHALGMQAASVDGEQRIVERAQHPVKVLCPLTLGQPRLVLRRVSSGVGVLEVAAAAGAPRPVEKEVQLVVSEESMHVLREAQS